jgi:hypothetical protein
MPSAFQSWDESRLSKDWDDRPEPPRTSPGWYTWVWIIFAFLVMVLTAAGLSIAGT